jgi:uncharacterized protein
VSDVGTLVVFAGAFAGAVVSSFSGFAFAPVAGVFLLMAFSPKVVVPVLMICSILVQAATLLNLRRSLEFRSIGAMLAGGALGVPLALMLFHRIDAQTFQVAFGLFLVAYALLMLLRPRTRLVISSDHKTEVAVGFFGGLIGGLTAMPGAVPVLYCDSRGVSKEAQRATVQPFILAMQLLALTLMVATGAVTEKVLSVVTYALPALGAGIAVGLALFGRVPEVGFRRAVLFLLLATGGALAARPNAGAAADWSRRFVGYPEVHANDSASSKARPASQGAFIDPPAGREH